MDEKLSRPRTVLFAAIMAVVVAVAIEALLQSYYYATVGEFLIRRALFPIYAEDDVRCYKVVPNFTYEHRTTEFATHIYTNSQGLRTDSARREYAIEKPADVYRILLLGPSFAFGWGVDYEATFANLLEREIRAPGRTVEVMNLGTPSQGPAHQLCWFSEVGHAYAPDLVVLSVYGMKVPAIPTACPENLACPIIEDRFLYSTRPSPAKRVTGFLKKFATVFYGWRIYNTVLARPNATSVGKELHAKTAPPIPEGEYDALADTYLEYTRYIQRHTGKPTPVAFIHIPYAFVVHPEDEPRWRHLLDARADIVKTRIDADMSAMHERGIPIVDTMSELIRKRGDERFFYWIDIHLTEAGNRGVADAAKPVLQAIIERDLSTTRGNAEPG